jgi:hypothetical protein
MAKGKKKEEKEAKIINLARELPTPNSSLKTSKQEPPKKERDNE